MMKWKVLISIATVLWGFTGPARGGETLYNGIELPDDRVAGHGASQYP